MKNKDLNLTSGKIQINISLRNKLLVNVTVNNSCNFYVKRHFNGMFQRDKMCAGKNLYEVFKYLDK